MEIESQPIVLLVEDDVMLVAIYRMYLSNEPLKLIHVDTGTDALAYLQQNIPNVILLDLGLPDINGMEILKYVQQQRLNSVVIVVTAAYTVEVVVEAMHDGAFDFLEKPFTANQLIVTLRNALRHQNLNQLIDYYIKIGKREQYYDFIGASEQMQTIYLMIDNIANSKAPVFITGESGTGKELCAQAIHQQSQRSTKPLIAINCAAIPPDLMESEIFGHIKGAFTGALKDREGAASLADGGTLFLDEIGDMDINLQRKLLRFVQTGTIQKVGSNQLETVDIRFICATHYDLLTQIKAGRFREDLYYRLNVIAIKLPPLRERAEDVLLMARDFLTRYAKEENKSFVTFAPKTEAILKSYEWPGNVRQLQNVIRHIVVLNEGQVVTPEMLPALPTKSPIDFSKVQTSHSSSSALVQKQLLLSLDTSVVPTAKTYPISETVVTPIPKIRPLRQVEKELIEQAIEFCEGDIPKAAMLLEIDASTIYRKIREGSIQVKKKTKNVHV